MTSGRSGGGRTENQRRTDFEPRPTVPLSAFLVTAATALTRNQLAGARRRLAELLADHEVRLKAIKRQKAVVPAVLRALKEKPQAPVAVIDEGIANPAEAPWLRELKKRTDSSGNPAPQVIYVTRQATSAGTAQAKLHPLVRGYVLRDDKGRWVDLVADRILELLRGGGQTSKVESAPVRYDIPGIVGTSRCFREAVGGLAEVFDSPHGLVTGEVGVGKMFLIRSLFRHRFGQERMIVLPCGVFFKDYHVGGSHRLFAGGREAVEQLTWYLNEADGGMLILHHVERLPTAVQDELATVLQESAARLDHPTRLTRVVRDGIDERDVRVLATSTLPPELLERTGRMLPELVRRLARHHVRIPSLRERGQEDIRLLAYEILPRVAASQRRPVPGIEDDALATLGRATWPNNVSDLVRALEHACRECRQGTITRDDLPEWLDAPRKVRGLPTLHEIVNQAQRVAILNALDYAGGDITEAARMLGRNAKGLYRLMKSLKIKTRRLRTNLIRRSTR